MNKGNKGFEILNKFNCNGKDMLVVRCGNNTHITTMDEFRLWNGKLHHRKWNRAS